MRCAVHCLGWLTGSGRQSARSCGTRWPERLRIGGLAAGTRLAYDGEVAQAPHTLVLDKATTMLSVYRPLPTPDIGWDH